MKVKHTINYLYFTLIIIYVSLLSLSHILSFQHVNAYLKFFLSVYAVMQTFLEVLVFILIGLAIKRISTIIYRIYIGLLFLFLIAHYVDFTVIRLMDTTIITTFKVLFASGLEHFFAAVKALNLNFSMTLLILISLSTIPLIGVVFYIFTNKLALKKPLSISFFQISSTTVGLITSLVVFETIAMPYVTKEQYVECSKTLPLKNTFLSPNCKKLPLANGIKKPSCNYKTVNLELSKKPNIYIFVIETLRKDIITKEIAPNLYKLKEKNIEIENTYSNANASHKAWFSIFHSKFPYHFKEMSQEKYHGALPLKILKDLGYKIHVHSSADLKYFNMDQNLFGKNCCLVDKFYDYSKRYKDPSYRDKDATKALLKDMKKNNQSTCFIVFLDSTHSEYSWPKEYPTKFLPISKEIDYLTISHTRKGLDKLINRYKNSVNYVDFLFNDFFKALGKDCIVAITGDHGEEFFENGALFHGTHLNYYQTAVPILYKLNTQKVPNTKITSHVDIFPTIFDILTGSDKIARSYLDGTSIFSNNHPSFAIIAQQNGGENPVEFSLTGLEYKMILRFIAPENIYNSTELELIKLQKVNQVSGDEIEVISNRKLKEAIDVTIK